MRDDRERLQDIRDATAQIQKYTIRGREACERDELIQTWIVHHLLVLGEAARALSPELLARYPQVPWSDIVGFRNILIHEYFRIDRSIVWSVVERNLPDLNTQVNAILADLGAAE